jgi:hypothetical protein
MSNQDEFGIVALIIMIVVACSAVSFHVGQRIKQETNVPGCSRGEIK